MKSFVSEAGNNASQPQSGVHYVHRFSQNITASQIYIIIKMAQLNYFEKMLQISLVTG